MRKRGRSSRKPRRPRMRATRRRNRGCLPPNRLFDGIASGQCVRRPLCGRLRPAWWKRTRKRWNGQRRRSMCSKPASMRSMPRCASITINDSVLTVAQAIAGLRAAMGGAADLGVQFSNPPVVAALAAMTSPVTAPSSTPCAIRRPRTLVRTFSSLKSAACAKTTRPCAPN